MDYYVITGGPGVGKTTLIRALAAAGYRTVDEDARRIIREQQAQGGRALPWKDKAMYADAMFGASCAAYMKVQEEAPPPAAVPIFFDRGLLDAVCYMEMEGLALSGDQQDSIMRYRYAKHVFILPPWRAIYETDSERKQSWAEASDTYRRMKEVYAKYGYLPIDVPQGPVPQRCAYILQHIGL